MKTVFRLLPACFALLTVGVFAETDDDSSDVDSSESATIPEPAALDQITAPIALYPDALVAIILPASTNSSDVVLAQRYLQSGGDPGNIDAQPWDDSVKSLARYPELVKWMDENLAWTQQMGSAYLASPDEVMASVQRLRAKARANGTLVDTPQQQVVVDATGNISIVPAQPTAIYVPRYDPEIIFVERPVIYDSPLIYFGIGFSIGDWLVYDCDWGRRRVCVGDRHHWRPDTWRRPIGSGGPHVGPPPGYHAWHPRPDRPRPIPRPIYSGGQPTRHLVARPHPLPGAPFYQPGVNRRNDIVDRNQVTSNPRPRQEPDRNPVATAQRPPLPAGTSPRFPAGRTPERGDVVPNQPTVAPPPRPVPAARPIDQQDNDRRLRPAVPNQRPVNPAAVAPRPPQVVVPQAAEPRPAPGPSTAPHPAPVMTPRPAMPSVPRAQPAQPAAPAQPRSQPAPQPRPERPQDDRQPQK